MKCCYGTLSVTPGCGCLFYDSFIIAVNLTRGHARAKGIPPVRHPRARVLVVIVRKNIFGLILCCLRFDFHQMSFCTILLFGDWILIASKKQQDLVKIVSVLGPGVAAGDSVVRQFRS